MGRKVFVGGWRDGRERFAGGLVGCDAVWDVDNFTARLQNRDSDWSFHRVAG